MIPRLGKAACAGVEEQVFFTDGVRASAKRAKQICGGCPIRLDCLELALANERHETLRGRYGIFGGKTPTERARIAKQRRSAV